MIQPGRVPAVACLRTAPSRVGHALQAFVFFVFLVPFVFFVSWRECGDFTAPSKRIAGLR
jgi:hypothetical protein